MPLNKRKGKKKKLFYHFYKSYMDNVIDGIGNLAVYNSPGLTIQLVIF